MHVKQKMKAKLRHSFKKEEFTIDDVLNMNEEDTKKMYKVVREKI